jgi:hypothetical protein
MRRRKDGASDPRCLVAESAASGLLVVCLLAAGASPVAAGVCTVPGTHASIQAAIDDPACTQVDLAAQTYDESIHVPRSLTLAGPGAGGAVVEGLAQVVGAGTTVTFADLAVRNGCDVASLRVLGGAQVSGSNLEVEHSEALPCPPSTIFEDGFESGDTSAWATTVP